MNEQTRLEPVSKQLKDSWDSYTKHFNTLVPIMLVAGIGMYLQSIFMFFGTDDAVGVQVGNMAGQSVQVNPTFGILAAIAALIYIVGMIWGFAALLNRIQKLDQVMTLGQAFSSAKPLLWPLILTGILVAIFTLVGFVLLIIPGIIVGVWLSLAMFIVVDEQKKGMAAVKQSKEYVKGYWWSVFGRFLLIGLILGIVSAIIGNIGMMILGVTLGTLLQNIVGLILIPFALLYEYGVYKNIKAVKGGAAPAASPSPAAPATV